MKITYSKGYPSLKSLRDASNEYDNRMHLYMKAGLTNTNTKFTNRTYNHNENTAITCR